MRGSRRIGFWGDKADGRIVDAGFAFVVVLLDRTFFGFGFRGVFRGGFVSVFGSGHEILPKE